MIRARVCVCICKSMFSCRKTKGSNMGIAKPFLLLLLLIVTVSASQKQRTIEARALSSLPQQKYSKIFPTLGVVCKCCDSTGSECTTTWTGSCHDLQCLPWKI
ncbi:hypothetical protein NC651_035644 [Populus alba x Populus x berolinensis]|nr:hypothetical protein NC651_035644 [Populus alba x Populus x berolinensis]